jgi:hypothetical protein
MYQKCTSGRNKMPDPVREALILLLQDLKKRVVAEAGASLEDVEMGEMEALSLERQELISEITRVIHELGQE